MSNINSYKSILARDSRPRRPAKGDIFEIETSFYKKDATFHDVLFFHASASGVAIVLLVLIIKGETLFPGTVTFFGPLSSLAIFTISIVLLILAFYFFTISILKLGHTLSRVRRDDGKEIKSLYAIGGVFAYFLVFATLALILV